MEEFNAVRVAILNTTMCGLRGNIFHETIIHLLNIRTSTVVSCPEEI